MAIISAGAKDFFIENVKSGNPAGGIYRNTTEFGDSGNALSVPAGAIYQVGPQIGQGCRINKMAMYAVKTSSTMEYDLVLVDAATINDDTPKIYATIKTGMGDGTDGTDYGIVSGLEHAALGTVSTDEVDRDDEREYPKFIAGHKLRKGVVPCVRFEHTAAANAPNVAQKRDRFFQLELEIKGY